MFNSTPPANPSSSLVALYKPSLGFIEKPSSLVAEVWPIDLFRDIKKSGRH